jgi:hypothetical protein
VLLCDKQKDSDISIQIGTGIGKEESAFQAGRNAAKQAMGKIGSSKCDLVLVFSSVKFDLHELIKGVRSITGQAKIVGCTTSGEITNYGRQTESTVVLCMKTDTEIYTSFNEGIKTNGQKTGEELSEKLIKGFSESVKGTMMILPDGLAGNLSPLVRGIYDTSGANVRLVGGSAGDDFQFKSTYQIFNDKVTSDGVCGILFPPEIKIGIGIKHGWSPIGELMVVTKSEGNILYELNNRPALDVYFEALNKPADNVTQMYLTEVSETSPIGIVEVGGKHLIRHLYAPTPERGIACFGDIPQESIVSIMSGDKTTLIKSAEEASLEAISAIGGRNVKAVIVFDCVSRVFILKEKVNEEIEAIKKVLGRDIPIFGFYTYGEIGAFEGGQPTFHNKTIIVCTIAE